MKMDYPEELATQDTQQTRQINVRAYRRGNEKGQSRKNGNIGYTREKTNKDNPEKLATQVHQTQEKINVREYGRVNEKIKFRETGNIGYTTNKTNKCQRIPKGKYKRTIQIN